MAKKINYDAVLRCVSKAGFIMALQPGQSDNESNSLWFIIQRGDGIKLGGLQVDSDQIQFHGDNVDYGIIHWAGVMEPYTQHSGGRIISVIQHASNVVDEHTRKNLHQFNKPLLLQSQIQ